ncbi:ABC transporter [Epithele typhae]|uniref:ABC transporter n=1 Tax=Epithele typhae TaxID=378194 RepID=UPI002008DE55|nr:ABC transporter [Epithele typhae]KAH9918371.1 ABC transporter [Epithele typhae]
MSSCENYGLPNGTSCACPPGFGGSNCSQPACGGDIFQGSARPLASGTPFANLTSCACMDGWTGTGCNVCQTTAACQAGFSSVVGSAGALSGVQSGQNGTIVCSLAARVYAAGEMSCGVLNPTIQSLFPGSSTLTILRTLNAPLTPLPNTTAFGSSGSVYAQLFYQGVEQFYCTADSCAQDLGSGDGSSDWNCQNLQCTCRAGTSFCGATSVSDLTGIINTLNGHLGISCDAPSPSNNTASCAFQQDTIQQVFGSAGLALSGCTFGECVAQNVIDTVSGNSTDSSNAPSSGSSLSPGVIAGLAVVGGLVGISLFLLCLGWLSQRRARKRGSMKLAPSGGVSVAWADISYFVAQPTSSLPIRSRRSRTDDRKVVLDNVSGRVVPGEMMAILGPSGQARQRSSISSRAGRSDRPLRVGFVPQQDVLPPMLTVQEALLFAARLRLPEGIPDSEKAARVDDIMERLGIAHLRDVRIGSGERRGISGGEMRRVSIGLELVAQPDVLLLDEPTSGLDSVSAAKVAKALHALAHYPDAPTAVLASIHQPSSQLYHTFDKVLLLAHGRALYSGPGGFAPAEHFAGQGIAYKEGYNVADYLLDIASDPPVSLFPLSMMRRAVYLRREKGVGDGMAISTLSGREWKILKRDKTLFLAHIAVACVLGVFCGKWWPVLHTDMTIAGFQSRVGCLFFLGALIAFSSLSALYNVVETRTLFLRERSASYYSPAAWLLSRFLFDVLPLRIVPTIIVSTITYWMAGLAADAAHFFKFLFILVLYTLVMTLFVHDVCGFFVHLNDIPPVLRWLQWLCPLKYTLEALSVNEVGSGLQIEDTLAGVPVNISAALIMQTLTSDALPAFGFGQNNYYRTCWSCSRSSRASCGSGVRRVAKVRERR